MLQDQCGHLALGGHNPSVSPHRPLALIMTISDLSNLEVVTADKLLLHCFNNELDGHLILTSVLDSFPFLSSNDYGTYFKSFRDIKGHL